MGTELAHYQLVAGSGSPSAPEWPYFTEPPGTMGRVWCGLLWVPLFVSFRIALHSYMLVAELPVGRWKENLIGWCQAGVSLHSVLKRKPAAEWRPLSPLNQWELFLFRTEMSLWFLSLCLLHSTQQHKSLKMRMCFLDKSQPASDSCANALGLSC